MNNWTDEYKIELSEAEKYQYIVTQIYGLCGSYYFNNTSEAECPKCPFPYNAHKHFQFWDNLDHLEDLERIVIDKVGTSDYGCAIYAQRYKELDRAFSNIEGFRQDIFAIVRTYTPEEVINACIGAWEQIKPINERMYVKQKV